MARAEVGFGISRRVSDPVLSGCYLVEPKATASREQHCSQHPLHASELLDMTYFSANMGLVSLQT